MPGGDGYELIRALRARGFGARELPAVAVSAFAGPEDRSRALTAGYQVHMPKPVDASELSAIASSLIGGGES